MTDGIPTETESDMPGQNRDTSRPDMVIVTGMSGAGRSTVLHALEDLGFEAVDNLPLGLLARLAAAAREGGAERPPVAVGVDVRTRDFNADILRGELDRLIDARGLVVRTLFLDCEDEALIRRFAETRRRHPLASDRPVADGIRLERRAVAPLRELANLTIDTTELTVWDLKDRIKNLFGDAGKGSGPTLTVMSFAYRNGVPREADLVFDVRFLANPHYDPELRPLTGLDEPVGAAVSKDPDFKGFLNDIRAMLARTLPRYEREGKSYLTIAVGCTGGRHRSVFTAERLAEELAKAGHRVHRFHRDLPTGRGMADNNETTDRPDDDSGPEERTS